MILQGRYRLIKEVGQGNFAKVYLAENIYKNERVAIKFDKEGNKTSSVLLQNEIDAYLYVLRSHNKGLIGIKSFGVIENRKYIIMKYLYMDIKQYVQAFLEDERIKDANYIHKNKITNEINRLLLSAIELLTKLHDTGLLHRDIKPENILLDKKNNLQIIDLGLSIRSNLIRESTHEIGTTLFSSFNVHKKSYVYSKSDDIISIYYCMIYIISGTLPWEGLCIYPSRKQERNLILYNMKRYTDLLSYYRKHPLFDFAICPVIKSLNAYVEFNMQRFYS